MVLAALLMVGIIPALGYIDDFQLKHPYAPYVMIAVTLLAAYLYPSIDEWSTCRGDTMLILGTNITLHFLVRELMSGNVLPRLYAPIECIGGTDL